MSVENVSVLAYAPDSMKLYLGELKPSVSRVLTVCDRPEELPRLVKRLGYQVVLLPADLPTQQWLSAWGLITTLDPRPSILVYTLESDFSMWSGLLEAGAFDVLVAPFTQAKLIEAIEAAAQEFQTRLLE